MSDSSAGSEIVFGTVAPQFVVVDVVRAAEHYRDVLGFEITDTFLDPPVHAIVTRGYCQVFLAVARDEAGTSNRRLKPEAIDAYFRVRGVEALADELASLGADIVEGPVRRSYDMLELVVRDGDGFVLVFGEDVGEDADEVSGSLGPASEPE